MALSTLSVFVREVRPDRPRNLLVDGVAKQLLLTARHLSQQGVPRAARVARCWAAEIIAKA